jgi:uncharacterized membrane protein
MRRQTRSVVLLKVSRCQDHQQRNADMPTFAEQVADRTPKQHASTRAGGQVHTDPIWSEVFASAFNKAAHHTGMLHSQTAAAGITSKGRAGGGGGGGGGSIG